MKIIAEGGHDGPFPVTSLEQRIDDERSAGVRACVDMGGEGWYFRDYTRKMVVNVEYLIGVIQKCLQKRTVALQGDVKNGQGTSFNPLQGGEQGDVPFGSGDQNGIRVGRMQTELMQGTDSVGIAIKDVILHGLLLSCETDAKGAADICQIEQQHDALVSRGVVGTQFNRPAGWMIDKGYILFYGLRLRQ